VQSAASGATGAIVGAATEAAIAMDRPCAGPYRLQPLAPDDAKKHLERLSWSG